MSFKEEVVRLSAEIAELTELCEVAKLSSVKAFLNTEISRLKNKKNSLEKELENAQNLAGQPVNSNKSGTELGITLVDKYMWDQTNDYVKIYIEVDKSQKIEDSQLSLKFASKNGFTCVFGKYRLTLGRLFKDIDDQKSSVKVTKSNRVIITLYKSISENWPSLNFKENALKAPLTDDKDIDADPSAGLMKLMKNMYDEGDDEMKRTITKSWYESRNKQTSLDPEL